MAMPKPVAFLAVMAQKKGLKNMKFNFLQKQPSRREMLRGSATLAGSAFEEIATANAGALRHF